MPNKAYPMTTPMLATRDALIQALHELVCLAEDPPTGCGLADALLASGVVRDPATLADDARAVVAVAEAIDPDWNKGAAVLEKMSLDRSVRVLRALAAALTEADR